MGDVGAPVAVRWLVGTGCAWGPRRTRTGRGAYAVWPLSLKVGPSAYTGSRVKPLLGEGGQTCVRCGGGWSKVSGVMGMLCGLKLMEGLSATADPWEDAEGCSGMSSGESGGRQAGGGGSAVYRPVRMKNGRGSSLRSGDSMGVVGWANSGWCACKASAYVKGGTRPKY